MGYTALVRVTFFTTAAGRCPVLDYINNLAKPERARVLEALEQVERRGFDAIRVEFRQIDGKLWEVKIGSHRVFYVMIDRDEMVLLHAYKKQQQKLPVKERDIAIRRMKELLS
ncbi:MAG: type II toxin-antitoxin system RelE/ParE family toxin [Candidatus Binatia bacterium]